MPSFKRIVASPAFQGAVATAGAWYLRLVWYSSRVIFEPPNVYEDSANPCDHRDVARPAFPDAVRQKSEGSHRAKVLISRHRDGEINARAAEKFGIETIRGSGAHNGEFAPQGRRLGLHRNAPSARAGLQCRAHRRRAEGRARRRARRHQAGATFRPADLSGRDRHQPPLSNSTTGIAAPSIFRSAGSRSRRANRSTCRTMPTARRSKPRACMWRTSSTGSTARAYEIADRKGSAQP